MDATQVYVSEFIGTAVLMAFGSSCNAGLLLKNTLTSALKSNWIGLIGVLQSRLLYILLLV